MSSKTKSTADPNRRLYPKRSNITPTEKRTNSNAQNQKNKSNRRNISKDFKAPLTKQDLIKQHIDLLDELQNLKAQLEFERKNNKKLTKQLRKIVEQNETDDEIPNPRNRRSNSKRLHQDDDIYNDYSENNYEPNYSQNEEDEEEENFNRYQDEEDEEEQFGSDSI